MVSSMGGGGILTITQLIGSIGPWTPKDSCHWIMTDNTSIRVLGNNRSFMNEGCTNLYEHISTAIDLTRCFKLPGFFKIHFAKQHPWNNYAFLAITIDPSISILSMKTSVKTITGLKGRKSFSNTYWERSALQQYIAHKDTRNDTKYPEHK